MVFAINFETIDAFIQSELGWATGIATAMSGLTILAGSLLNQERKDEIALWIMGAPTEQGWSQGFVSLFDAVFGHRHLSLRCFLRSAIASIVAVTLLWTLLGSLGLFGSRLRAELSLGQVLFLALAVNVVADYLSLLETRFFLGRMRELRSAAAQAFILLLDLVISALIIWFAIIAYLYSPLYKGDIESFAEILGIFSIFSVMFYSTFLTSVWTWAYVISTWVLRFLSRLHLSRLLDIENKPIQILALLVGIIVFAGSITLAVPLRKNADGITVADRALCSLFSGPVCLDVARLSSTDLVKLELVMLACSGGATKECLLDGFSAHSLSLEEAVRIFTIGCEGEISDACTNLGVLYEDGVGVQRDRVLAMFLYKRGCDGGDSRGCNRREALREPLQREMAALSVDSASPLRFAELRCRIGSPQDCTILGYYYQRGFGLDPDPATAALWFSRACEGGDASGCTFLGHLFWQGAGRNVDRVSAIQLYERGCHGGHAEGCILLGLIHEHGIGIEPSPAAAANWYRKGCSNGSADSCLLAEKVEVN